MYRRDDVRRPPMFERRAAFCGNSKGSSQDRLSGGGSQTYNHPGRDQFHLSFEPWDAGADLSACGFLVDSPFPSLLELEMLGHVCCVNFGTVNGTILKHPVQHPPRRARERVALEVLLISGLLANHKEAGFGSPFAKDGPRCILMNIASFAQLNCLAENRQRGIGRNPYFGAGHLTEGYTSSRIFEPTISFKISPPSFVPLANASAK
jgi:hypothetical protein